MVCLLVYGFPQNNCASAVRVVADLIRLAHSPTDSVVKASGFCIAPHLRYERGV
jgi:hypothetical protein